MSFFVSRCTSEYSTKCHKDPVFCMGYLAGETSVALSEGYKTGAVNMENTQLEKEVSSYLSKPKK